MLDHLQYANTNSNLVQNFISISASLNAPIPDAKFGVFRM